MFRSLLLTGSCALELSSAFHEAVLMGYKLGTASLFVAAVTAIGLAARISGQLTGRNLPKATPDLLPVRE
jgi:hypothetical protein